MKKEYLQKFYEDGLNYLSYLPSTQEILADKEFKNAFEATFYFLNYNTSEYYMNDYAEIYDIKTCELIMIFKCESFPTKRVFSIKRKNEEHWKVYRETSHIMII